MMQQKPLSTIRRGLKTFVMYLNWVAWQRKLFLWNVNEPWLMFTLGNCDRMYFWPLVDTVIGSLVSLVEAIRASIMLI